MESEVKKECKNERMKWISEWKTQCTNRQERGLTQVGDWLCAVNKGVWINQHSSAELQKEKEGWKEGRKDGREGGRKGMIKERDAQAHIHKLKPWV